MNREAPRTQRFLFFRVQETRPGKNPIPVEYESVKLDMGFRADMIVDNAVIVENKTVEKIAPIHEAQLLTYLKITGFHLGFLLNWNVPLMKQGINRIVNNLKR
jgi:GxxExxY protein